MLPSLGYLKSINCPFYQNGLCERPYCHFRHVRRVPDVIESISNVLNESSADASTSDPALLKVVNDEIKKIEAAVNEEKAKLNNLTSGGGYGSSECDDAVELKSCWSLRSTPQYKPTPINQLKKLNQISSLNSENSSSPPVDNPNKCKNILAPPYQVGNNNDNDELLYTPTKIIHHEKESDEKSNQAVNESLSSYTLNAQYSGRTSSLPNKDKCNKNDAAEDSGFVEETSPSMSRSPEENKISSSTSDANVASECAKDVKNEISKKKDDSSAKKNKKHDSKSSKKANDKHEEKSSHKKNSSGGASKERKSKDSSNKKSKDKCEKSKNDSKSEVKKSGDSGKHRNHSKDSKSKNKDSKSKNSRKHSSHRKSSNHSTSKHEKSSSHFSSKKEKSSSHSSKREKSSGHSSLKKDKSSNHSSSKNEKTSHKAAESVTESSTSLENSTQSSQLTADLTEEDGAKFIQILKKKRMAHQPNLARKSDPSAFKPKISPAEVMHNRFLQMQKAIEQKKESQENDKKRQAHIPASMLAAVEAKKRKTSHQDINGDSVTVATTNSKGTKRVAHLPSNVSSPRPRIPTTYGSKVPSNIRQRYLNLFIDECLKIYPTEKDAYDRALQEEKAAYARSANRTVYLNVVVNATKKLRDESKQSVLSEKNGTTTTASSALKTAVSSSVKRPTANRTVSHEYNLAGAKAAKVSYSIERVNRKKREELTDVSFYQFMKSYLLSESDLVENSFPRKEPSSNDWAVVKNLDEKKKITSEEELFRKCSRCQTPYHLDKYGQYVRAQECLFHWGRLYKQRTDGEIISTYSCCQGDRESEGCSVAKGHVDDRINPNKLRNFVETVEKNEDENDIRVYAIDCEMCYSSVGMELTRVTVINRNLQPVYEALVRPKREIVDYNTRFSGITEKDLVGVTTTLEDVQSMLLDMFSRKTILVGHSLNSDLLALKIIHDSVVDTSVVFPHRRGPPFKRALRTIMAEYLMKIIQNDVEGHDSNEDAKSCMELMIWKVKEDMKKKHQQHV